MFETYFGFGFTHLLDVQAYDHLLFLAVLCAGCGHDRPRELLVLVTAFTAGHSASLALATLQLVRVPGAWVEFLVLATIAAGAALNLATGAPLPRAHGRESRPQAPETRAAASESRTQAPESRARRRESGGRRPRVPGRVLAAENRRDWPARTSRAVRYATTVLFGLVHGLGFSNFLSAALGTERSLLVPLLSFNLGLEAAQVVAVAALSLLALVVVRALGVPPRAWAASLSVAAGAGAAVAAVRRWPL